MNWNAFQLAAPELAAVGRERFTSRNVMVLATLRRDGSPRISAVNPFFVARELLIGSMRSAKVADLLRDPRCALHSAIVDGDGFEGEFKIFGRAIEVTDPALRNADREAWWVKHPPEKSTVFAVDVASAVYVKWDWDAGTYETLSWSADGELKSETRSYP
jgi:hypothetical protein